MADKEIDPKKVKNTHGQAGWCGHLSRRTAASLYFTDDDNTEEIVVNKRDCVECPYCNQRRPINI